MFFSFKALIFCRIISWKVFENWTIEYKCNEKQGNRISNISPTHRTTTCSNAQCSKIRKKVWFGRNLPYFWSLFIQCNFIFSPIECFIRFTMCNKKTLICFRQREMTKQRIQNNYTIFPNFWALCLAVVMVLFELWRNAFSIQ